jgi:hypothetical protein
LEPRRNQAFSSGGTQQKNCYKRYSCQHISGRVSERDFKVADFDNWKQLVDLELLDGIHHFANLDKG